MQHNTQVPVGKHNNRQHASPHHEVATDVKQMPIRPIIIIIIIKTLSTNCRQICQIMEVTKCFAAFIATPKDLLCYTAQSEPAPSDLTCSHILQSDMKEIGNKTTTGFLKGNTPSAKRAKGKWIKNSNYLSLVLLDPVKISRRIL